MRPEELAARLLTTFLAELDEQVATMNADLLELEVAPGDAERLKSLLRVLHTIKGAARVAGVPLVEEACHGLEASLVDVREGRGRLDAERFRLLRDAADALADAGRRIREGLELDDAPIAGLLHALEAPPAEPGAAATGPAAAGHSALGPAAPKPARPRPTATRFATSESAEPGSAVSGSATPGPAVAGSAAPGSVAKAHAEAPVRVRPEELDTLLKTTVDLLIAKGQIAGRPAELDALHARLRRLSGRWRRAASRLRSAPEQADAPAGVTALLREVEEDLRSVTREAGRLARAIAQTARDLDRATDEVAEAVHRLRLQPFDAACLALPRVIRDVATVSGRLVDLVVEAEDVRVDRAIVDALREPLVHLVRNAVDHGIEPPAERIRAGKPERGTIRVQAVLRGGRLSVSVSDDGRGLDIPAIRAQLEQRGLDVALGERDLLRVLFAGGVSTRKEATAISGRGVGLDVVRATLEGIGGSVDVRWTPGQGTTFVLECPPSPARVRALLAVVNGRIFAVPTAHVERLHRVDPSWIRFAEGRPVLSMSDTSLPFRSLAAILGPPLAAKPIRGPVPVMVLHGGGRRLAVAVDDLLVEQELVFRPLERGRVSLPHVGGGVLLPTGQVALVLNPSGIIDAGLGQVAPVEFELAPGTRVPAAPARHRVLVVDDSITTRTLEQNVLEAAGYDVLTAADGEAAWRLLQEQTVDLIIADIEMPRLDGFGLCRAIRVSERLQELPVILVTALETAEHRARGLEAGADAFLAKSSFDQEMLLETVGQLLGRAPVVP